MEHNSNYLKLAKEPLAPEFWEEMYSQCHICYQVQGQGKTIGEFVDSLNGECQPCKEKQYAGFVRGLGVMAQLASI